MNQTHEEKLDWGQRDQAPVNTNILIDIRTLDRGYPPIDWVFELCVTWLGLGQRGLGKGLDKKRNKETNISLP